MSVNENVSEGDTCLRVQHPIFGPDAVRAWSAEKHSGFLPYGRKHLREKFMLIELFDLLYRPFSLKLCATKGRS